VPSDLRRESTVVFEAGGDIVDVVLGFNDGFARIAAFEFSKRGKVLANFVRESE
jgi:hypothetical protein